MSRSTWNKPSIVYFWVLKQDRTLCCTHLSGLLACSRDCLWAVCMRNTIKSKCNSFVDWRTDSTLSVMDTEASVLWTYWNVWNTHSCINLQNSGVPTSCKRKRMSIIELNTRQVTTIRTLPVWRIFQHLCFPDKIGAAVDVDVSLMALIWRTSTIDSSR